MGGVETGSMYVQCVQGIQPNVPAHTTCNPILYSNVDIFYITHAQDLGEGAQAHTGGGGALLVPLSSA